MFNEPMNTKYGDMENLDTWKIEGKSYAFLL